LKVELDLELYSATNLEKEDDLFSSNFVGESYSITSPVEENKIANKKANTKNISHSFKGVETEE